MPFQPCPNIAAVELRMSWDTKPVEYVLHYTRSPVAAWSAGTIQALAENVFSYFTDEFGPLMANAVSFDSCYVRDLTTEAGLVFEYFPPTAVTGQLTGEIVPNNVAIVMTHRTALAGRSYRGRTYLGGFTEAELARSFIVSSYGSSLETAWEAFASNVETDSNQLVILSRRTGGLERVEGIGTPVVSSGLRNLRVDTQRRRLPA